MRPVLRFHLAAILLLAAAHAMAAEQRYESVDAFIKSLPAAASGVSPSGPGNQVSNGDLNADGLEDAAIVTGGTEPRLFVLLQGADHAYRLAVSSKAGTLDQILNSYVDVQEHIRNGSLYVSTGWEGAARQGSYTMQYQFKLYRGKWRMIGMTYSDAAASYTPTPSGGVEVDTYMADMNLLTGSIIVTRATDDDSGSHSRTTRYEVAPVKICLLEDFAFDASCAGSWKTRHGTEVSKLFSNLF